MYSKNVKGYVELPGKQQTPFFLCKCPNMLFLMTVQLNRSIITLCFLPITSLNCCKKSEMSMCVSSVLGVTAEGADQQGQ